MSEIYLSVLIPTYNRASELKRCLLSCLTYPAGDIEFIVQDNASPDHTESIVRSFDDKRIKYFKNEYNVGLIKNFYKIILQSKGRYSLIITDDDYLLPGALEDFVEFLKIESPYYVKCRIITYLEKAKIVDGEIFSNCDHINKTNQDDKFSAKIFDYSHTFTGICFSNEKIRLMQIRELDDNWYPNLHLASHFWPNLSFYATPIAVHTWENETYWEFTYGKSPKLYNSYRQILDNLISTGISTGKEELIYLFIRRFKTINNFLFFGYASPIFLFYLSVKNLAEKAFTKFRNALTTNAKK